MTGLACPLDKLKAIVFDLDGTLYQNERMGEAVNFSACRYIASLKRITIEEADTMLVQARNSQGGLIGTLSRAVESLGGNLQDLHAGLSRDVRPEGVLTVDPRVPELLRRLATRFELDVYTNNNRELSARIMREIGIHGLFDRVFTIEDYWQPKPDETALLGILETIGRNPDETLFVGDRYDVDLALPASLGCQIYESCTIDQLMKLEKLVEAKG